LQLDPWKLRNHLIYVMLGKMSMDALIQEQAGRVLPTQQAKRLALSLNAQKERQRMFTSCGWYFEDFNRLESKYNLAYAAQAVWLARQATGVDLSPELVSDLRHVVSHRTGLRGDAVFMRQMEVAEQMTRNR
jgi:hypothetical protein